VTRRALIVGAGIGGLAAGRALRAAGLDVRIVERAPELEPLGAGISLWPNAVRALADLGVEDVASAGRIPDSDAGIRRWDGRLLARTDPAAIEERYGAPLVLLHRATLHRQLLSDGTRDLVETGVEVVGASERGGTAIATTRAGETLEADLLIGADGIHSTVRAGLLADGGPRDSGLLAYRAITDLPGNGLRLGEYWGAGAIFGLAPVDGERLYWYATARASEVDPGEGELVPQLLRRFGGWAPEIRRAIQATPPESVLRHPLYDRPPTASWTGRATALIGDSAHPMLPFLGQGACQALEDAVVLAEALTESEQVADALGDYEQRRRRRVARIVRQSRRIARLSHLRSRSARAVRDRIMSLTPEGVRLRQLDRIVR
jgi:2-polyprenyl-6-methoxyphenol hydroxylase-like FAD-dependent oxidoreductase